MAKLSYECTSKLKLIIPMLTSNFDGEVVATARAITRTLKTAGFSIHDLCETLTSPVSSSAREKASHYQICIDLLNGADLSEKEINFLSSIKRRSSLSEKQQRWFNDICEKYGVF